MQVILLERQSRPHNRPQKPFVQRPADVILEWVNPEHYARTTQGDEPSGSLFQTGSFCTCTVVHRSTHQDVDILVVSDLMSCWRAAQETEIPSLCEWKRSNPIRIMAYVGECKIADFHGRESDSPKDEEDPHRFR